MRQPNATIRLDEALRDLQNRLSTVDDAEKDRLIAALGGPLVAKIPQVLGPIPATNMLLAVPLFLDILQSGRVGTIDGLIDGAPGTVPREWLPPVEFTDVGVLCGLPAGREIHVTEGRIDRQSWDYLFAPPPPPSETSEPRPYVSIADIKEAGWNVDDRSLQRYAKEGLITDEQLCAFRSAAALADLRRLHRVEPVPDAPGATATASPPDPESEPPSVVEGATNEAVVAGNLPAEAMPLAEWIFAQHPRDGSKPQARDQLLREARKSLSVFTRDKFYLAYRCVYETKIGQPPAAGWPLREPYRSLLAEE